MIGGVILIAAVAVAVYLSPIFQGYSRSEVEPVTVGFVAEESDEVTVIKLYPVKTDTTWDRWTFIIGLRSGTLTEDITLDTSEWRPSADDLDDGPPTSIDLGEQDLGEGAIRCTATDIAGDGRLGNGDCLTITGTSGLYNIVAFDEEADCEASNSFGFVLYL